MPGNHITRRKNPAALTEYRRKRDFKVTSEPQGGRVRKGDQLSFVIQKHAASHLHYDFRLELDGVLKSWAVPKGPSLDPATKRLAMHVEDHPVEYGGFEGIIPQGEYGGGTVLLWDQGTWEPNGDARQDYRDGHLKFHLHGSKLQGGWMLVRKGARSGAADERHWFLFKERDEFADPDTDITESMPLSVTTGRDLDKIAEQATRVWGRNGEVVQNGRHPARKRSPKPAVAAAVERKSAKRVKSDSKAGRLARSNKPSASRPRVKQSSTSRPSSEREDIAGVSVSHPDKVLYPDDGITKRDLANYYEQVAAWMLPHVKNRLLSLVRCPAGSGQKCFFQKHPGEGTSEHLRRFQVQEKQKVEEHLALYDLQGLISLVQMGVLEIHIWGSQADQFEKPDRLIFDLDPDPAVNWPHVVVAAKEVRLLLEQLDLTSFIKTSGGKGLHIVVPIRRRMDWPEAKSFCRAVADFLQAAAPDRYIATMSKAARKGKIYVDYLRNDRAATAVAPYSTRSRPGATISVPIAWDELTDDLKSDHFNIQNLPARLKRLKRDPWAAINTTKQTITAAILRKLQNR